MTVLPIIKHPDPLLREVSKPIERVDADLRRLIDDMFQTMYAAPGVGLAAIQVGIARRVLVMDPSRDEDARAPIAMVNPQILEIVGDNMRLHEEGCLSIPDAYAEVERPAIVRVGYLDRDGAAQERLCEDFLATIVQHEIDHLDGRLFIDHLSRLKRTMLVRRYLKAQKDEIIA